MDVRHVLSLTRANGGASVDMHDDQPVSGYMVSVYPEVERIVRATKLSEDDIVSFIAANAALLHRPDTYFGTWVDDHRNCHLDISVNVDSFTEAVTLALDRGQTHVYELATGESFPVAEYELY